MHLSRRTLALFALVLFTGTAQAVPLRDRGEYWVVCSCRNGGDVVFNPNVIVRNDAAGQLSRRDPFRLPERFMDGNEHAIGVAHRTRAQAERALEQAPNSS